MFEGIEDSSDDDSLHSIEGVGDEEESIVGRIEVEGQEVGNRSPQMFGSPEKDRAGSGGVERKDSGEGEHSVVV